MFKIIPDYLLYPDEYKYTCCICFSKYHPSVIFVAVHWSSRDRQYSALYSLLGIKTHFESRCHGNPGEKSGPFIGRNLSEVVNKVVWVRQLAHKVPGRACPKTLTVFSHFRDCLFF